MPYGDPVCLPVLPLPLPINTKVVPIIQHLLLPHCTVQLWRVRAHAKADLRETPMRSQRTRRQDEQNGGPRLQRRAGRSVQVSVRTQYIPLRLQKQSQIRITDAESRVVTETHGTVKRDNLAAGHAISTENLLESITHENVINDRKETPRKTEDGRRRGGKRQPAVKEDLTHRLQPEMHQRAFGRLLRQDPTYFQRSEWHQTKERAMIAKTVPIHCRPLT